MGLTPIVHTTLHSTPIPPGAAVQIITRPQRVMMFRPLHLTVDPECAPHFNIDDVTIGNRSQTPQSQRVAAGCYANGAPWICETIMIAMEFVMFVTNRSDQPRHFCATWLCATSDDPEAVWTVERDELHRAIEAERAALRDAMNELELRNRALVGAWTQIVGDAKHIELPPSAPIKEESPLLEVLESRIGHVPERTTRPELERKSTSGFGWDPYGA